MAGVTENDDWTENSECGDRALAVYYVEHSVATKPSYRFSTYNSANSACNPYSYR